MRYRPNKPQNQVKLPAALAPLTREHRWVDWRLLLRNGKMTKPPLRPSDPTRYANHSDPTTWGSYEQALSAVRTGAADGIGFCLKDSNIAGLDLDDCYDPRTGKIDQWAQAIIEVSAGAYVEVTPGRHGLRIIGYAKGGHADTNWKIGRGQVEVYRRASRYLTITGQQIGRCRTLTNIDALIDALLAGKPKQKEKRSARAEHGAVTLRPSPLSPERIIELCDIGGNLKFELLHGEPRVGARSAMLWKLGNKLHEKGVSRRQAYTLLWASPWNKHKDQGESGRIAMERMICKIWMDGHVGP